MLFRPRRLFTRRYVRACALAGFVLLTGAARGDVEVYPGPGVDAVRSSLYTVEVFDGSSWIPAYVYGFSRLSVCHWHWGAFPTVNFLTFGTTGPVDVRVSRIAGSITSVDVSPHSKNIPVRLSDGRAVLTLNQNHKAWVTLNGDDANPLFLFADPPKPPVPPGATYAPPGISKAPGAGNHYKASNGEVIYLDGGSWVRGNIDLRGTRNVRIMGPGILSGDLWTGEQVGSSALPFDQFLDYAMIRGEWSGGTGASVEGITIVDSPGYNFFGGATNASGVKILSPWFYSTDGFQGVSRVDQSFIFNGDNAFAPMWAGVQNDNVTITSSFAGTTNNSVFAGGYWGYEAKKGYSALASDIDIKTYNNDDWVSSSSQLLAAAFQIFVDNSDPTKGYSNQTYQNIRIEGDLSVPFLELKNLVYLWGAGASPPLGNSDNLVFRNITLTGTQKYRSQIKGWDANNGFHNVVLENVSINGTTVNPSNVSSYFDINSYVWGLSFGSPGTGVCTEDAETMCLVGGRYKVTSHWQNQYAGGAVSTLKKARLTDATGAFFLSDSNTYEYLIRINTATDNGRAWISIPTFTDVEFWIAVTDMTRGQYFEYHSPAGNKTLIYDPFFFVYP